MLCVNLCYVRLSVGFMLGMYVSRYPGNSNRLGRTLLLSLFVNRIMSIRYIKINLMKWMKNWKGGGRRI